MDFVSPYINFIKGLLDIFPWLAGMAREWWELAGQAEVLPSPWLIAGMLMLYFMYFCSPFLSATFAEEKGRSRGVHFAGGLLLPGLYPFLVYRMRSLMVDEPELRREREEEKRRGRVDGLTDKFREVSGQDFESEPGLAVESDAPGEERGAGFDRLSFAAVAADPDCAGVELLLDDGREIRAAGVLEVMDDVVVLEVETASGARQKVRVMYERIRAMEIMKA